MIWIEALAMNVLRLEYQVCKRQPIQSFDLDDRPIKADKPFVVAIVVPGFCGRIHAFIIVSLVGNLLKLDRSPRLFEGKGIKAYSRSKTTEMQPDCMISAKRPLAVC